MTKLIETGQKVLKILKDAGYEAFFVGGFVRDYLLKLETNDIDITTNALPEQIEALFDKVFLVGKAFGTVTVLKDGFSYEVTTYRKESEYDNHRHPSTISFSNTLSEDLSRRDFTINQLTMDEDLKIYDHYNGLTDLKNKIIRTINAPFERFEEDALRLLRAFRFVSKLGFNIEPNTLQAIQAKAGLIKKVSIERIQNECFKLFEYPHANKALTAMIKSQFHTHFFGLKDGIEKLSTIQKPYDALDAFTILFLESGYDETLWRLSNKDKAEIKTRTKIHLMTKEDPFTKPLLFSVGLEAALKGNKVNVLLGFLDQEALIINLWEDMPVKTPCELTFKGEDMIKHLNISNRRYIGQIIDEMILKINDHVLSNEHGQLKQYTKNRLEELERSE